MAASSRARALWLADRLLGSPPVIRPVHARRLACCCAAGAAAIVLASCGQQSQTAKRAQDERAAEILRAPRTSAELRELGFLAENPGTTERATVLRTDEHAQAYIYDVARARESEFKRLAPDAVPSARRVWRQRGRIAALGKRLYKGPPWTCDLGIAIDNRRSTNEFVRIARRAMPSIAGPDAGDSEVRSFVVELRKVKGIARDTLVFSACGIYEEE